MSIKNILYVEDGSVDVDKLEEEVFDESTLVIVHRQGTKPPTLLQLEKPISRGGDDLRDKRYLFYMQKCEQAVRILSDIVMSNDDPLKIKCPCVFDIATFIRDYDESLAALFTGKRDG